MYMEAKYKVGDKVIVKTEYDIDPNTGKRYDNNDYLYAFPERMLKIVQILFGTLKLFLLQSLRGKRYFQVKNIWRLCKVYSPRIGLFISFRNVRKWKIKVVNI